MPENEDHRNKLMRWVHFLVDPFTSMATEHRVKRNRYLCMICTSLLTGNCLEFMKIVGGHHVKADAKRKPARVAGVKQPQQPELIANDQGIPLTIVQALNPSTFAAIDTYPEWEREKSWDIRLEAIKDADKLALKDPKLRMHRQKDVKKCSIHVDECPTDEVFKKVGQCLDNQFKFLLTLSESYQQVMTSEKEKINLWLQALSRVDKDACVEMKGIRNDYIMLIIGYLVNGELKGPFEDFPTGCLQPMTQAIATYIAKRKNEPKDEKGKVPLNPVSNTVEAFMNSVPKIDEGAFALLSISGNLFLSSR